MFRVNRVNQFVERGTQIKTKWRNRDKETSHNKYTSVRLAWKWEKKNQRNFKRIPHFNQTKSTCPRINCHRFPLARNPPQINIPPLIDHYCNYGHNRIISGALRDKFNIIHCNMLFG